MEQDVVGEIIMDWTTLEVEPRPGKVQIIRYRVYRSDDDRIVEEVDTPHGSMLGTCVIPNGTELSDRVFEFNARQIIGGLPDSAFDETDGTLLEPTDTVMLPTLGIGGDEGAED